MKKQKTIIKNSPEETKANKQKKRFKKKKTPYQSLKKTGD